MSLRPVIAIHGGAGRVAKSGADRRRKALGAALDAGYEILQGGGSSLDAVAATVAALEDSALFNAGRGAVRNAQGRLELDASLMEGARLRAGGVACVSRIRNPILAARAVMEHSKHVLLAGTGAERFARKHNIAFVDTRYFRMSRSAHGTVGAVALDREGNLAAATSRRLHRQAARPRRRLADHRCRHLRRQPQLRRLRHRRGRVLHPRGGGL